MKILIFAVFLLIVGAIILGLNCLIKALTYDKNKRYLHIRVLLLLLSAFWGCVNGYTIAKPLEVIDAVINAPQLAPFFNAILPNRSYELIYMMLVMIGLNLLAAVVAVVTILTEKILFGRKDAFIVIDDYEGLKKLLHFPWMIVEKFYDYDEGTVRLRECGVVLGIWTKGLKWTVAGVWVLEMVALALLVLWGPESWNNLASEISKIWYLLPMIAFFVIEQMQFFLEGEFEEESGTFGSANILETQRGSIPSLVEIYRRTFAASGALAFSGGIEQYKRDRDALTGNRAGARQKTDCSQPEIFETLINQLAQSGVRQSDQYQNALSDLLDGRSINVCDCCEGEFLPYLVAYMSFYASQGKNGLVICKKPEHAKQIAQAMQEQMRRLNDISEIWTICTLENFSPNKRISILLCTVEELCTRKTLEESWVFTEDLSCVVVADGADLLSRDCVRVERVFGELRKQPAALQYVLFTAVSNDSLRTAMEQAAGIELVPFSNENILPDTSVMLWKEEGGYRLQHQIGIGNHLSPYMGSALPLALVAVKYDLPELFLLEDISHADKTYNDALAMSSKEVAAYIERNVNLKSVIRRQMSELFRKKDLAMLITYDTDYNFYNALWKWSKYGGSKGTLLHIIAPPYMLREYFAANCTRQNQLLKNNEFDAFRSAHLGLRISRMIVLLTTLCDEGMTEQELMEKCREYQWQYESLEQLLEACLRVVLNKEELHNVYESFRFENEKIFREDRGTFEVQTRVTLRDATICARVEEKIRYAEVAFPDGRSRSLSILCGDIGNYYQRGQLLVSDGFLYQIRAVGDEKLYVEQTVVGDVPEYYQISEFAFEDFRQVDSCVDSGLIDVNICSATVSRKVKGYWASNRGYELGQNADIQIYSLRGADGTEPVIRIGNVNILEINIRKENLGQRPAEALRLLAFMIKELFKTLFPETHQNLFAVVDEVPSKETLESVLMKGKESTVEAFVRSLVPGVEVNRERDEAVATLYIVEMSSVEYGMVEALYRKQKNVFLMLREYLSWYMNAEKTSAMEEVELTGRYLHFGGEAVPEAFDPEGLLKFLQKLLPEVEERPEEVQTVTEGKTTQCTFCGRETMFPVDLGDGRCMCGTCKEQQLDRRDEVKELFTETVQYITRGYAISLPSNLHVRFQSADAIRRVAGGVVGGRVLGFYSPSNHQLWLEARGPRLALQSTLVHELTHAWQNSDRVFSELLVQVLRKYPKKDREHIRMLLVEGHAVYMEIETMSRMNEEAYAQRMHMMSASRTDEYGEGYRLVCEYLRQQAELGSHMTPFKSMVQLLQDILDGKVAIQ